MQVDGQGIDEHWAHITSNGVKTYISDHLGTVVNSEVTDENKITGAFGEILQDSPSFEFTSNPVIYGFTGRQFEPESGLYYYRNRSYDPTSGRFMTKDPLGIQSGDVNLYRYVGNSPVNKTDPYGLFDSEWFGMMNSIGVGGQVQQEAQTLVNAYATTGGVALAAAATPFAVAATPVAGAYVLAGASNPANIVNAIDFMDSLSGVLGGPTTGLPSLTPGAAAGTFIGLGINELKKGSCP